MLNRTFSIGRVFLVSLSKKKPSELVFRNLPLAHAQPGSLALKQIDGWRKRDPVGAGRKPAPSRCLAAEELGEVGPARRQQHPWLVETDPFSATAQECGSRWSSRCWKEGCNQSHPPRKIPAPLTEGKEPERPLHSQIYGPQQAGKNPVNISANPASVRSYRVIGVNPCQTRSCCPSQASPGQPMKSPSHLGPCRWRPRRCRQCWVHQGHGSGRVSAAGQAQAAAGGT